MTKKNKNGSIPTRGRVFTGTVISDKMSKTVTVQWERRKYVPKYERYARRWSRIKAHNPENINAKKGQIVQVMETRPISKTKNFVVIKVLDEKEAPISALNVEEEDDLAIAKEKNEKKTAGKGQASEEKSKTGQTRKKTEKKSRTDEKKSSSKKTSSSKSKSKGGKE